MILSSLLLQHFRSYTQAKFDFNPHVTVVIGPNTAGKTNLSEAVSLLLTGKSFRTSHEQDTIAFEKEIGRIQGLLTDKQEKTKIEVTLAQGSVTNGRFSKRFLVNGVPRTRATACSLLPLVIFRPEELDIVIAGPSLRRSFLDSVLEQTDKQYLLANAAYIKALRQRNALLDIAKETGRKNKQQFDYWDNLLIENGQKVTQKREEFIAYLNTSIKDVFALQVVYDKSTISHERLLQYEGAEIGAGNTLVGPQRDDFFLTMDVEGESRDIKQFGSRGQQRLAVLQLKLLQIAYVQAHLSRPLLLLDDIFSELDSGHIQLVWDMIGDSQAIITTTHKEFLPKTHDFAMIELDKT